MRFIILYSKVMKYRQLWGFITLIPSWLCHGSLYDLAYEYTLVLLYSSIEWTCEEGRVMRIVNVKRSPCYWHFWHGGALLHAPLFFKHVCVCKAICIIAKYMHNHILVSTNSSFLRLPFLSVGTGRELFKLPYRWILQ